MWSRLGPAPLPVRTVVPGRWAWSRPCTGAMIVARLHRDPTLFDQITAGLVRDAMRVPPRSYGNADADRPWPARVRLEQHTAVW